MPLPLDGLRVLDLSRALAGPFCSQMLGDMGAAVLKVEQPGVGDNARGWGPPFEGGESSYFLSVNRNKRSIALNLRDARGTEILRRLVAESDVLLENFMAGMFAAYAVQVALYHRARSGVGQRVDTSLLEGQLAMMTYQAGRYFATGEAPTTSGNLHPTIVPYGLYRAA